MKRSLTAGIPAARSRYPITATVSSSTREAQSRSIRASGPCSAGAPHAAVTRVTVAHQSPVKVVPDLSLLLRPHEVSTCGVFDPGILEVAHYPLG